MPSTPVGRWILILRGATRVDAGEADLSTNGARNFPADVVRLYERRTRNPRSGQSSDSRATNVRKKREYLIRRESVLPE